MFVCKLTKTASRTGGRIELPAASLIGCAYHCNHALPDRILLELTIQVADDQRSQFSLPAHPLCCQSPWARAAYYMVARRIVRSNVSGRDRHLQAWQAIASSLRPLLPLPPTDAYWDIRRELFQERQQTKRASTSHTSSSSHTSAKSAASRSRRNSSASFTKAKRKIPSRPLQSRPLPSRKLPSRPLQSRPLQSRPLPSRELQSRPLQSPPKQRPASKRAVPKPPVPKPPVTKPPVTKRPVAKRPVTKRPVTKRPVTKRPVTKRPVTKRPVTKRRVSPLSASSAAGEARSASERLLPECFWLLGFESRPTQPELRRRFLQLATVVHPDLKGDKSDFKGIKQAYETAVQWLKENPPPA